MLLPIDYRQRPFKAKYIDEETHMLSRWMIFGEHPDGWVDIANSNGDDIFTHVPRDVAERMVDGRNDWVASVLEELNKTE